MPSMAFCLEWLADFFGWSGWPISGLEWLAYFLPGVAGRFLPGAAHHILPGAAHYMLPGVAHYLLPGAAHYLLPAVASCRISFSGLSRKSCTLSL